jgi:hypothetical protein
MHVGLLPVTPRKRYTFFIDAQQKAALANVKERDGISESEQIRRAIAMWLESKGVTKAERKRPPRRKRS